MTKQPTRVPLPIVLLLGLFAFVLGLVVPTGPVARVAPLSFRTLLERLERRSPAAGAADWRLLENVWDTIHEKYLTQPVDDRALVYGAAKGLVQGLGDPYSLFLDPAATKAFRDEIDGTFSGIGAEIGIKKDQLVIIAPLPRSPAERAGLKTRDSILAIDGTSSDSLNLDEAVTKIRGDEGSTVTLLIRSEGADGPREVRIRRETITVESVRLERRQTPGRRDAAVIHLSSFTEKTDDEFAALVNTLLLEPPAGMVLDLRRNPGGILDAAVAIGAEFVGEQPIVLEELGGGEKETYRGPRPARVPQLPIAVLVDGGSASASEILAGALQDYGVARVFGEQTFGKGSVQDYAAFGDGSSLKLTIARWLTPKGRSINESGITPDVVVPLTAEDFDADRDPQLDAALAFLDAAAS